MDAQITLDVEQVIGNGKPVEKLMIGELMTKYQVPKWCIFCVLDNKGEVEKCQFQNTRLLVLRKPLLSFYTPFLGKRMVACCEGHFRERVWNRKTDPDIEEAPIISGAEIEPNRASEKKA